jgi:hypothetical protein
MKYSQWIGIIAGIGLIISCFLPWTFHPDLGKTFNGFFSENNSYGKPGKALIFISAFAILCFIIPRVWAKRLNFFVTAILVGYAIRTFILFSGCYRGICPEKKEGLWMMIFSACLILIMAVLPDTKLVNKKSAE